MLPGDKAQGKGVGGRDGGRGGDRGEDDGEFKDSGSKMLTGVA